MNDNKIIQKESNLEFVIRTCFIKGIVSYLIDSKNKNTDLHNLMMCKTHLRDIITTEIKKYKMSQKVYKLWPVLNWKKNKLKSHKDKINKICIDFNSKECYDLTYFNKLTEIKMFVKSLLVCVIETGRLPDDSI